jgi:hypothetical protein
MTNSDHGGQDHDAGRELLIGLDAIARVAGVSVQVARRLIEAGELPVHKVGFGSVICATPSAIHGWRSQRKARAAAIPASEVS